MYSHAKRARKVQRGSNRRASSPREEDRARNLDKVDKDGDDRTRRKGGKKRERAECGRRPKRGREWGGGSGEEHEGESMYASTK